MSMNDFELPPEELFAGPINWFGVNNPNIADLDPLKEQSKLTDSWKDLFWSGREQTASQLERLARCLSLIIPQSISTSVNVAEENDLGEIEVGFDKDINPTLIFPEDELKLGRIPNGPGNLSRWIMVGIAPRLAIGGIVERPWLPPFMYEEGEPGAVKLRMLPLKASACAYIEHLSSIS